MAETAKWYVVHTYSGYENKVADSIVNAVENRQLHHLITDVNIPTEMVVEIKEDGQKVEKEQKLFPSYVFVKMIMTDDSWYVVRNTRGVTGFVGPGSKPVPLTEEEIANMGFLAGLAGLLTVARMTSAQPTYGQNYEMDAIGSCFIGGASAYGGTGTVPGVIVGAVLMGVINLGMSLMGVDQNMQKVVKGLVLLAAVIFDVVSKRGGKLIAKN